MNQFLHLNIKLKLILASLLSLSLYIYGILFAKRELSRESVCGIFISRDKPQVGVPVVNSEILNGNEGRERYLCIVF